MLKILIVEDEPSLAERLKYLIELNPRFEVTNIADDLAGALAAAEDRLPDLALVDLHLARGSTGFSVAVKLNELNVPVLFTSGKAPSFPMPDLALGCLLKPYSEEDLVRALKTAEDLMRGRECLRPSRPENLKIYAAANEDEAAAPQREDFLPEPMRTPAPQARSLRHFFSTWLAA
jgi:DNA-binding NarL/FixJ family response regulator